MCGLVGVASFGTWGIGYKERQIFQDLLTADAVRGSDGTGVFIVSADRSMRMLKKENDPFSLFRDKQWKGFFDPPYDAKAVRDLVAIGHNRSASVGDVNTKNAHPHRSGNIVLVHNGTLLGHSKLPGIREVDVDSEALAQGIAELGIDEAIAKTHGSYAIIYYDLSDGTLNVLRNAERPLFFYPDVSQSRLFFSSEQAMLRWVLLRQGITTEAIVSLKPNMLMSFEIRDEKTAPIPAFRQVEGPKVQTYYRHQNWTDYFEKEVEPIVTPYLEKDRILTGEVIPFSRRHRREAKQETRILKTLSKEGLPVEVVTYFDDKTVGDNILIKVCNFTESANKDWPFIMEAENPLHPRVQFRFRLRTLLEVEEIMENPKQAATIRRIMKFPKATNEDVAFVAWVSDLEPWPPGEETVNMETVTKLDSGETAEVVLDSANPGHPQHQDVEWKSPLDDKADPYNDPNVTERLLH